MMKNILVIILLISSVSFYAQRQGGFGGGNNRQSQNQNRQGNNQRASEMPKATDMAGLFYYDTKKVVKKLRVKDDELKASVTKALKDYNFKIKEITLLNADNFKAIDALMKSRRGQRNMNDNDENIEDDSNKGFRQRIGKIIRPIRKEVQENETVLNEYLQGILSEKQNKKWMKYQKEQKDNLKPKRPQRNNNQGQGQGQRGNRQRGGF